ncbi:MAG: hypothetical protein ABIN61_07310 [candidate division WOR-3 bacterium]
MKRKLFVALLTIFMVGFFLFANSLDLVNRSTVYKIEIYQNPSNSGVIGALYTTTFNNLQVITKHCVTKNTKIYLNDQPAKLSDLRPGYKVIVNFINDDCKTATVIRAYK